jgi:predicted DNA-binding protein
MASKRTQIYLTPAQRDAIDARMKRDGKSLAMVVREALDEYLTPGDADVQSAFDATFGAIPELAVVTRGVGPRLTSC